MDFLAWRIDLVHRNEKRLAGAAEQAREFGIDRSGARLRIHHENEQRCFSDGDVRLAKNFLRDERLIVGNDSAGVHDLERAAAPVGFAVDAIARDARFVRDDGATRAGKAVEERGLAYVRAADDDQRWQLLLHESTRDSPPRTPLESRATNVACRVRAGATSNRRRVFPHGEPRQRKRREEKQTPPLEKPDVST